MAPGQLLALHRAIVVVDVAGFTDRARTLIHQSVVRTGLYEVLARGFGDAGVDLGCCLSTSSSTVQAPCATTSPPRCRRLVINTVHDGQPGSSASTCRESRALSSRISIRLPETRLR